MVGGPNNVGGLMKAISTDPIYRTLRNSYNVSAQQQLIAEWNYNRFANADAFNYPEEIVAGFDIDLFPIDSIVQNNRPQKAGIVKGRESESEVESGFQSTVPAARYYVSDANDAYKYWTSGSKSSDTAPYLFPLADDDITSVRPTVVYDRAVETNKIVVQFETSFRSPISGNIIFVKPLDYEIFIKYTQDGDWMSLGKNWAFGDNGHLEIYTDGIEWVAAPFRENSIKIWGIQLRVYEMSRAGIELNLIELSARLEVDLTRYFVTSTDQFTLSDRSFNTPLGKASSNTASIQLWNGNGPRAEDKSSWLDGNFIEDATLGLMFNNNNINSPLYGLIDANVKFTLYDIVDTRAFGGIEQDKFQAFEMFSTLWSGQLDDTINIDLKDYSVYLQDIIPPKVFYDNYSLGKIVWQLCDICGFNNYVLANHASEQILTIDAFYTDGAKTLWEIFAELAEVTQSGIYYDSHNQLQIKPREAVFDEDVDPIWTLRGTPALPEVDDIVDFTPTYQYAANQVTVNYQPVSFGDYSAGYPVQSQIWTPTDTVVLREAPLVKDINQDADSFWVGPKTVNTWSFSGLVNIEAEIIRFQGKEFVYYTGNNRNKAVVSSVSDFDFYNTITAPIDRWKNHYTGRLMITERGVWNSPVHNHLINTLGYSIRSVRNFDGNHNNNASGLRQDPLLSAVTLENNKSFSWNDWLLATRGSQDDGGYWYFGTRMKFNNVGADGQRAGLVINNNGNTEAGYYIEFRPTKYMNAHQRKIANEIYFYTKTDDGKMHPLGGNKANTGIPILIQEGEYFEVDISFHGDQDTGNHFVNVWFNGRHMLEAEIDNGTGWRQPIGGKFGIFDRGFTSATFDYLYAIAREEQYQLPDDMSFLERVASGYFGDIFYREWVWRQRDANRRHTGNQQEQEKWSAIFMDEFGPLVHEVREFNVTFDPVPALSSNLLITNDEILCTEYSGDSFGAYFVLANAGRASAVVNGEDNVTFPGNTVNQQLLIFGNVLINDNAQTIVVKDDASIRRRGRIDIEFDSQWIQNDRAAQRMADWVVSQWSDGIDEIEVQVFGNILFELGDVVAANFPHKSLFAEANQYFIVGISNTHAPGVSTVLTLRERKN